MPDKNLKWISLAIVLTAPLLSVIDVFIVNVAIPTIQHSLRSSDAQIQLVVAGYLLGYASFMITGGRAGDYFGKKKVFFWSMFAFTVTSCLCGLAQSADQLNLARFFQGISASFMVPQTISYVQILFTDARERTKAFGFYGMTLGIASTLGQFLGGYFSSGTFFITGWRLIFFINVPIGLISLWAVHTFLEETPTDKSERFDLKGTFLLTSSLITFIYPLVQGRESGWPIWCLALLALSVCLFLIFINDQKSQRILGGSPLIDISLFSFRDFNIGLFAVICYFIFHTSYLFVSTLHFQETLQFSPMITGLSFVFLGIGFTGASLLSIKLVTRYGKQALQAGILLMIVMLTIQIMLFRGPVSSFAINSILFVQGLGMGTVLPSLMTFSLKSMPVRFAGTASGVYATVQQVASALGITIVGGLYFSISGSSDAIEIADQAYYTSLIADTAFLLLLSGALFLMPDGTKITQEEPMAVH